jgi:hypothetical protein
LNPLRESFLTAGRIACFLLAGLQWTRRNGKRGNAGRISHEKGEVNMRREQSGRGRFLPSVALTLAAGLALALAAWMAPKNGAAGPAAGSAYAQTTPPPPLMQPPDPGDPFPQMNVPESVREKQRRELRKYRFKKMQEHGEELAKLAKSLQEDLDNSNENILSLQIVDKAQRIEKLAKQIQNEARMGT